MYSNLTKRKNKQNPYEKKLFGIARCMFPATCHKLNIVNLNMCVNIYNT